MPTVQLQRVSAADSANMAGNEDSVPMLLHLPPGVTLEGLKTAENIMEDKVRQLSENAFNNELDADTTAEYTKQALEKSKLPDYYYQGMPDWPESTDLKCVGCGMGFSGPPWFVPISMEYKKVKEGGEAVSRAVFGRLLQTCSPNCSASYIKHMLRGNEQCQARENLVHLYYAKTGKRVINVQEAPFYTELASFGGKIPDKDFKRILLEMDPSINEHMKKSLDIKFEENGEQINGWDSCSDVVEENQRGAEPMDEKSIMSDMDTLLESI